MATLIGPGGIWGKLVLFLMVFFLYLLGPMQEAVLAAGPDLIMSAVSPNAATVNAGATLLVDNTVENQGAISSGGFSIAYRLSTNAVYGDGDDVVIPVTRSLKSLAAGTSNPATTGLKIPKTAAGNYYICAKADSASKVIETDEANNTLCSASQVTVPRPDLIMTDVSPNAATVNAGSTLLVNNTVKNQGVLSAGGFGIAFHLSTDAVYGGGDDVVISGGRPAKSLAAGDSNPATTGLKIPKTAAGNYYICAAADSANKVIETDEANNTLCSASQVTIPRPDLIMTDVSPNAATVNAGATLLVDNTVKNQGVISAGGFSIAYRLSTNTVYGDGDDVVFPGTRPVKSLAVGASDPATTGLKIPKTAAGTYYVCAKADSANKVIETDEANNSRCTGSTITVTGGGTPNSGNNGTLLFSVKWDEKEYIAWHKIVVDEDGDAMALWDVANNTANISSVWASYYNHTSGQWGQAQEITNDDVVIYYSLPEAKFDQNGGFVVANTGINLAGFSTWWNRFDPASGWGTQRTLADGRRAFGVNGMGEIFSQRPSNKEIARYNTNTGILTPEFTPPVTFGAETSMAFANSTGELLEAVAHSVTGAPYQMVVSLFSYSPVGGWGEQFDTPVLTFPSTTHTTPVSTAAARDGNGRIAVVVTGTYCSPCGLTTYYLAAAIYFDGAQWGTWAVLDSSTQAGAVAAPSVKIDNQGRAVALWANTTINISQPQSKLRASSYTPGSGWGAVTDVNTAGTLITSGPDTGNYTPEDEFTMSDSGDAIVSWTDLGTTTFGIRENRFHPATGWAGESQGFQLPPATTAGVRIPKAQVNSAGKGFRTWVWVTFDSVAPHIEQLRAAPVATP